MAGSHMSACVQVLSRTRISYVPPGTMNGLYTWIVPYVVQSRVTGLSHCSDAVQKVGGEVSVRAAMSLIS